MKVAKVQFLVSPRLTRELAYRFRLKRSVIVGSNPT